MLGNGDYGIASKQFDATIDLIEHFDKLDLRKYPSKWRSLPTTMMSLADKLRDLHFGPDLEEMRSRARVKKKLAQRYAETRGNADALFLAAERLRFRLLLGRGDTLIDASNEIPKVLEPFRVLGSEDWTTLDHILDLLDPPRLERLRIQVNELLFLWITIIDESLSLSSDGAATDEARTSREKTIEGYVEICDRALNFAEPKEPWRVLRARLERFLPDPCGPKPSRRRSQAGGESYSSRESPGTIREERSALAAFQWALLWLRNDQTSRAIQWMRHAVRIEQDNYWYQYFLAYIEDQDELKDEALEHYSVAVALKPKSPWVRFSRARLYRSKGLWSSAIEDMNTALDELKDRPEARQVRLLELGGPCLPRTG